MLIDDGADGDDEDDDGGVGECDLGEAGDGANGDGPCNGADGDGNDVDGADGDGDDGGVGEYCRGNLTTSLPPRWFHKHLDCISVNLRFIPWSCHVSQNLHST